MLVTRHWGENRKRYGLAMLAMGGLLAGWDSFMLAMDKNGPLNLFMQYSSFYIGLYFVGCLYASTIFSELSSKSQSITYLSVPASHLEKLLCAILFGVVLFFIVYVLIFYMVEIPMVSLANRIITEEHQTFGGTTVPIGHVEVFNMMALNPWAPIGDRKYHILLLGYFAAQSAFLLGSVYFPRYSFIKTIVAIVSLALLVNVFMTKVVEAHLPDGWKTYGLFQWNNYTYSSPHLELVTLPGWVEDSLLMLVRFSVPPVCWVIAYFRLKEKEV